MVEEIERLTATSNRYVYMTRGSRVVTYNLKHTLYNYCYSISTLNVLYLLYNTHFHRQNRRQIDATPLRVEPTKRDWRAARQSKTESVERHRSRPLA